MSPNERESAKPNSLAIRAVVKSGLVLVLGWRGTGGNGQNLLLGNKDNMFPRS